MAFEYIFVIGLISMVMLSILLLTYMAAKVFRLQSLEVWFNVELTEFFASFLVLFFAAGFFASSDAFAQALTGSPSAVAAATGFLKATLSDLLQGINDTSLLQICISILSTFTRRIGEFVLTLTYKVFPGLDSYLGITNVVLFGLTAAFGSVTAQLVLFQIIEATMVNFFLPAGILLRFFPPTREAGMFLIAFSIGFHSVFPLTYAINQQILHDMGYRGYERPTYSISSICSSKYFLFGAFGNPAFFFGYGPGSIPVLGQLIRLVFSELVVTMMTPFEFGPVMAGIASISLPALFLPAFSLTITFAFINAFMKFVLMRM